jgi:integrase
MRKVSKAASRIKVLVRVQNDRDTLTLYYRDPLSGRIRSRSAGTSDAKEAERAAERWEAEINDYHGVDGSGWQAFRDRFRDEHLAFKAANTRASYATALNSFEAYAKPMSLNEVNTGLLSRYAAKLLTDGRPHATVKSYLTHLRSAFRWAERLGIMRKAPHVSMPSTGKRSHMRGRPLTWRELGAMLRACRAIHGANAGEWRRLIKLLWYSGLRLGEALALSWDTPPLVVRLDSKPYPLIVIDAEGQKSRIDTASPIAPDFAAWLSKVPPELRTGYVVDVRNSVGKRFTAEKLSDEVSRIGKAAEVATGEEKYATAHDLRRSFATRWAVKVRPLTLQRMLRHSDLSTTLRYYVGLDAADVGAELWSEQA